MRQNFCNERRKNFAEWKFCNIAELISAKDYADVTCLEDSEINSVDWIQTNAPSLKGIEFFTALTTLVCNGKRLTELDVSRNTALTWLDCRNNQLKTLDVSRNTALTNLYCSSNGILLIRYAIW